MLKWVLLAIGLNSADALFTRYVISHGVTEWNPVMAFLLEQGDLYFFLTKLVLINVLVVLLFVAARSYKIAHAGFILTVSLYSIIFVYHVVNIWSNLTHF